MFNRYGIIEREKASIYATVDAEAFKYVPADMVLESGMKAAVSSPQSSVRKGKK